VTEPTIRAGAAGPGLSPAPALPPAVSAPPAADGDPDGLPGSVVLRVHGVGGATAPGLLGVESERETARVAGGGLTSFWARRADPSIEGYLWGRLSTGDPLQPLWVFLLPFTLLNVAGWMHQPDGGGGAAPGGREWSGLRHSIHRLVVQGLGITLTMTSVIWLMIIGVDLIAWQWGRTLAAELPDGVAWIGRPWPRLIIGGALVLLLLFIVAKVAKTTQSSFEAVVGPKAGREPRPGQPAPRPGSLGDPGFWERRGEADRLLRWHQLAALVAWGLAMAQAVAWAAARRPALELGAWIVVLGTVQMAAMVFLVGHDAVDLAGRARRIRQQRRTQAPADRWDKLSDGWRWFGPAVVAGTGVALSSAALAGWEQLLAGLLRDRGVEIITGAELALLDVIGVTIIVAAITLAVTLVARMIVREQQVSEVLHTEPADLDPPGKALHGIPVGWEIDNEPDLGNVRRIARHRRISELARRLDLVLTIPTLTFIVLGMAAGLLRMTARDPGAPWPWLPTLDPAIGALPLLPAGAESELRGLAGWILIGGTWLGVALLRALATNKATRQQIGTFWDILTFWPRRYHPLAVRPYAQRAVPELQHRIDHHVRVRGRSLVLAAHSQGSVLALAALLARPGVAERVALVTMGSPLAQLYARFFPAYFGVDGQFGKLRERLAEANPDAGLEAWRSFFRETDYVGKRVFGPADAGDTPLADPAKIDDPELPDPEVRPDPVRIGWTDLARHSLYWNETEVKAHIASVRAALAAARLRAGG
jgi:hypothetical protein